jgi:hypothetical protein
MKTTLRAVATLVVLAMASAGCGSESPPPAPAPSAAPIQPPSVEARAGDAALAVYNAFWALSEKAFAAPGSRDWSSSLESVASGQALESLQAEIANYASYPAHDQGSIGHAPSVQTATDDSVAVVDCLDMSNYLLVADETGEVLTDIKNRPDRFQYHATVTRSTSGDWLVDQTSPALDQPC